MQQRSYYLTLCRPGCLFSPGPFCPADLKVVLNSGCLCFLLDHCQSVHDLAFSILFFFLMSEINLPSYNFLNTMVVYPESIKAFPSQGSTHASGLELVLSEPRLIMVTIWIIHKYSSSPPGYMVGLYYPAC